MSTQAKRGAEMAGQVQDAAPTIHVLAPLTCVEYSRGSVLYLPWIFYAKRGAR